MQNYNTVPDTGKFGVAVTAINTNFSLTQTAITELEYSTRRNKGLFLTADLLEAAIPNPSAGDWALVGADFPASIYIVGDDGWEDSGETYDGDNVDLTDYVTDTAFEAFKEINDAVIDTIEDDVEDLQSEKGSVVRVNYWQSSAPTVASNGNLWYDTTNNLLKKATVVGTTVTWNSITASAADTYVDITNSGSYYWGGSRMEGMGDLETLVTQSEYNSIPSASRLRNMKYIIYEND